MAAVAVLLAAVIVAGLSLPRSFGLTAFSDVVQCLLLLSGTVAFLPLALQSKGRTQLFWALITLGIGLWLSYQIYWTYNEVGLRRDVPDLCAWDIILFLHVVPLMAAVALRPHVPRDEYAARVGRLDFALLIVFWLFLYVFIVMPWQYVVPDISIYNENLNEVYNAEKIVFLAGLLSCWITSKNPWKKLYAALFGMNFCYSAGSTVANWAIARKTYYSGSLYDVPLVAAMAWLTWIGLRTHAEKPDANAAEASTSYGVWIARSSMIAVFSIPLFAAWSMSDTAVPAKIRMFRLMLAFLAAMSMGVMVFIRQRMLDRELIRLLGYSQDAFDNLKRLQAQILQSEKLASVGQLVGGAAHELNNPITAMLGYSDLLLNTPLSQEQEPLVTKIGQHVRRTKSLVASLISFARQTPSPRTPIDLNTLARTAVKLSQPQAEAFGVEIRNEFDPMLPKIVGNSNQLLQVCLQLVGNALHVLSEHAGRIATVSTSRQAGLCVLQITAEAADAANVKAGANSSAADSDESLSLSACQGILREHRGQIVRTSRPDGAVVLRVELPVIDVAPAEEKVMGPVLRQSQPYA